MDPSAEQLEQLQRARMLVSVRRERVDAATIQGFLLAYSDALVLLHYVVDFRLDGLLLLRRRDITSIRSTRTDLFQTHLLEEEGALAAVDFSLCLPIRSWKRFLRHLPAGEIVILEDELAEEPEFIIGPLLSVDAQTARVRSFSGTGRWEEVPVEISLDRISSCQLRTGYTSAYARHFARTEGLGAEALVHLHAASFAALARRYCDFVVEIDAIPEADRAALAFEHLVALVQAAVSLPRVEPDTSRPEPLRPSPPRAFDLGVPDLYWEVYDPFVDDEPGAGSLLDDLTDIYADLERGLLALAEGRVHDAVWEWRWSYQAHWGDHAVDALRVLHRALGKRDPPPGLR